MFKNQVSWPKLTCFVGWIHYKNFWHESTYRNFEPVCHLLFYIKCLVSVITAVYGQTLIFEIIFKFRCPRYPNLDPTYCQLVYDPTNPCCQKPQCMTVSPTPGPGISVPPPTPAPSPDVCVYQGVAYRQGQTFNQGCDKICKCEDSMTGKITCTDR